MKDETLRRANELLQRIASIETLLAVISEGDVNAYTNIGGIINILSGNAKSAIRFMVIADLKTSLETATKEFNSL